ncbi:efflux RND transporter periplasmic adaptor subunit [Anaeromyxobacter paludicola]|uniref:CzcB-like barrel-sandwich hybrid domain-containing protein n=1 Tax=Anaeromyxobacter paludicola TaxID=2918171 RepID=A0ABM7XEH3_9BACT|nr:efflux RND transporter periplasmic adaptor subunit [Anaeromyxobacter paludicola]BDG10224.1 hypothetical protein AMPC_33370 [Anaeromyxobacter paludicola]
MKNDLSPLAAGGARRAALPLLALLLACKGAPSAPQPEPTAPAAPSAATPWVKARTAEGLSLLEAPATVLPAPESSGNVVPPFRARVARVHVRAGEQVRKGQPVCDVIMPEVLQAAGTYAAASTRVQAYQRRRDQLESLKKEGLVRAADLLEVETRLAEAKADQQGALATLRVAGLEGADAARLLAGAGQLTLRSPIDGIVTEVKASLGETREAAGEPIARVAGEGEARVEARLARSLPAHARYELALATGERHPLALIGRAPVVDGRDGTALAWFSPPAAARLTPGLAGRLVVQLGQGAGAAVPARAVALAPEGAYVVVNRGGAPARVAVQVLATSGADALVRGDLKAGDEVAADAALAEARPGAGVPPAGSGAAPPGPAAPARSPLGGAPDQREAGGTR